MTFNKPLAKSERIFLFARTGDRICPIFEKVYEIVKKIPAGKVATYGQIARLLERLKGQKLWGGPS